MRVNTVASNFGALYIRQQVFVPMSTFCKKFCTFIDHTWVAATGNDYLLRQTEITTSRTTFVWLGLLCNSPADAVVDSSPF